MDHHDLRVNAAEYVAMVDDVSVPLWRDARLVPAYVAGILVVEYFVSAISGLRRDARSKPLAKDARGDYRPHKDLRSHIGSLGGARIFAFRIARAICVLALLAIYAYDLSRTYAGTEPVATEEALKLVLFITYLYASLLGLLNITAHASRAQTAGLHLVLVLLASCAAYGFRDIWPLMTYTLRPLDAGEGALLWLKISLLALAGIIIPLISPRQYVPLDPENPSDGPHPEQTCSLLSLLTYSFMNKSIYAAYNSPSQAGSDTLTMADYDRMPYLVKRNFKHLDIFSGARRRHMGVALLRVYNREFSILACMMVVRACTALFAPVGINRLLTYLETGGEGAIVRPWVWCTLMFLGPFGSTLLMQYYSFITTKIAVHTEGMLTELIFEHALRLRVKSETRTPSASAAPTPETASIAASTTDNNGAESDASARKARSSAATPSRGNSTKIAAKEEKGNDEGANFVGKINNLVTTDLQSIGRGRDFTIPVFNTTFTLAMSLYFLYLVLGWSTFVGMAIMIICLPIPGYLSRLLQRVQKALMQKTDARVQTVTEMMSVLRMIKMFGWEKKIAERLDAKRTEELRWLRSFELVNLGNNSITLVIPILQMVATYATFTLVMGGRLTASIVFPSMTVFMLLRNQIGLLFYWVAPLIESKVSLDRLTDFLRDTELLDQYSDVHGDHPMGISQPGALTGDAPISIRDASFTWSAASDGTDDEAASGRAFTLRVPGELAFRQGKVNLIVGPTGSGKTSLLMALLGEMHCVPLGPGAWVSLPRAGGVAYAAQESWVQNETIRDNILFGAPYDEVRYKKVIHQCALKRDLSLFDSGDKTEVGEKGLTLSGGQKARVTLARAIYSSAEIVLLDDILAALDVHTARWIVDKCLMGDLVRGRTVILVTHNIALVGPIADFVVALGNNGSIAARGSYKEVLSKDKELAHEAVQEEEKLARVEEEVEEFVDADEQEMASDGKLIVKEEVAEGHVSLHALTLFWGALGGRHPILFWATFLGGVFSYHALSSLQSFWLGRWAEAYTRPEPVDVKYYMGVFLLLVFVGVSSYLAARTSYAFGVIRSAKKVHAILINSILSTTLRWLDQTPVSRVITRCTKDIKSLDSAFASSFLIFVGISVQLITQLIAITLVTPVAVVPGVVVFSLGAFVGNVYMKAALPMKRVMSNSKAPVLGHFGAAIAGLISIRAYGAQDAFRRESYKRIESYTRSNRMFYNLNRWISTRSDALGGLFASGLGLYLVYGPGSTIGASNVGFSLAMTAAFSDMILWWVRAVNSVEVEGNSLERIQAYLEIEQEPKPTEEKAPPASWPTSGDLRIQGLSARYSPDGPKVLHNLSFNVRSGERVGIVGRTGSGKSSLTLSLLRLIFTEGDVYYDGVNTANINLDALRTAITIIPQVPELLSGTLRENLDPFGEYDDAVLNSALRASGLFSLQDETDEGRITLDSQISSGGGNLSVGQRQILALARALVRGSKLLILDEATSSIDYKTDAIIQSSLRRELGGDVTLLTVAHRLQTIMDADKIMVLDAGRIVEFDTPLSLLKRDGGFFKSLVDESGDKDTLYTMAGGSSPDS
ncbi:unnamed protein product [Peniophora sp. CBMAI 1063]|nr:unnamed protein product [Peniophora sp. CBMAI 1063]